MGKRKHNLPTEDISLWLESESRLPICQPLSDDTIIDIHDFSHAANELLSDASPKFVARLRWGNRLWLLPIWLMVLPSTTPQQMHSKLVSGDLEYHGYPFVHFISKQAKITVYATYLSYVTTPRFLLFLTQITALSCVYTWNNSLLCTICIPRMQTVPRAVWFNKSLLYYHFCFEPQVASASVALHWTVPSSSPCPAFGFRRVCIHRAYLRAGETSC